ncbi:MFS transporter [Amycolatopsis thermalba]|uniref:MFS transporter n=1 Tax=Amycolatopsis thermalba TaxID=944492 RepID=UPI003211BDC6
MYHRQIGGERSVRSSGTCGGTAMRPGGAVVLALVCAAQFMVVLDVSVINVALPSVQRALGFGEAGLPWVVNAYTLTFAGFLLLGGRLADVFGRRRVFVAGLALFAGPASPAVWRTPRPC